MVKRKQTTALPKALREELGLGNRRNKKQEPSRKERRKLERQEKKQKRSRQHSQPQPQAQPQAESRTKPKAQPSKKRPRPESDDQVRPVKHAALFKDPNIEAEEKEIERLEKLLGISESKGKKKLNKELSNDGFGDDFGLFLARLDKIGSGDFGKEEEDADEDAHSDENSDDWESELDEDDPFDDDIPRPARDYDDSDIDEEEDEDEEEEEEEEEDEDEDEDESEDEEEIEDGEEAEYAEDDEEVDDEGVGDEEAPALVDASHAERWGAQPALGGNDAYILQEEQEIARLEKLLGLQGESKSKKKKNLEKELKKDGFSDDFVNFLQDLDDLSTSIRTGKKGMVLSAGDEDSDAQEINAHEEGAENSDDDDDDDEGDESDDDDEHDDEGEEEDEGDDDDDDDDEGDKEEDAIQDNGQYYRPSTGEDIYGRSTSGEAKYVPPAQRAAALRIDESSDSYILIKRRVNGLMNRLSFESKDGILRDLKAIYAANSKNMTNNALKDAIFAVCANESQMMSSLIPLYAGLVAALHFSVGMEVGGYVLEHVYLRLHTALEQGQIDESAAISSKVASNMVMLLAYLYNLGIVHGAFMKEIVDSMISKFEEVHIELLLVIFKYCGQQLRHDDQMGFRAIVNEMQNRARSMDTADSAAAEDGDVRARVRFMVQMLGELNGKKERKSQGSTLEQVQQLRKWLGQVKTAIGGLDRDVTLRMTTDDLLRANERGRWWLPGASWKGKELDAKKRTSAVAADVQAGDQQMEQLLQLATQMRMNTDIRKKIFVVIMSSRDVEDAVERLLRLNLKGSQDREIPRVILDCCGQESKYNPFYVNLAKRLCELNRQFKTTFQFAFWDTIKQIEELPERRVVNLARFLGTLICSFHLSMAVFKVVDLTTLRSKGVLFIATCLMSLFSTRVPDDTFGSVLDRVAATSDHRAVRDTLILFLQKYLPDIPEGLDDDERKSMRKRRKAMIRVFEDMSVLDLVN